MAYNKRVNREGQVRGEYWSTTNEVNSVFKSPPERGIRILPHGGPLPICPVNIT